MISKSQTSTSPLPQIWLRTRKEKIIRGGICRGESGEMGSWSRFGGLTKGCFKSVTLLSPLFLHLNEIWKKKPKKTGKKQKNRKEDKKEKKEAAKIYKPHTSASPLSSNPTSHKKWQTNGRRNMKGRKRSSCGGGRRNGEMLSVRWVVKVFIWSKN